jgi:SHAQKYF class myb-like DNA-binding protein
VVSSGALPSGSFPFPFFFMESVTSPVPVTGPSPERAAAELAEREEDSPAGRREEKILSSLSGSPTQDTSPQAIGSSDFGPPRHDGAADTPVKFQEAGSERTVYTTSSSESPKILLRPDRMSQVSDAGVTKRSKKNVDASRVVWTDELHQKFLRAYEKLGSRVVPKEIWQEMNEPTVTRENIASHLQKFRIAVLRRAGGKGARNTRLLNGISEADMERLISGVKDREAARKIEVEELARRSADRRQLLMSPFDSTALDDDDAGALLAGIRWGNPGAYSDNLALGPVPSCPPSASALYPGLVGPGLFPTPMPQVMASPMHAQQSQFGFGSVMLTPWQSSLPGPHFMEAGPQLMRQLASHQHPR